MKRLAMAITMLIFLVGCTSKPQIKTVFVEPKKFNFEVIEVNVSVVPAVPKLSLDGKINYADDSNSSIKMSVETWLSIRNISHKKTKAIERLRLHKLMFKKALDAVNRQIKLYLKYREQK